MLLPETGKQLLCLLSLSLELTLKQLSSLLSTFCTLPLSTQLSLKLFLYSLKTLPTKMQASSTKEKLFNLFQPLLWQTV